jgi:ribonuclease BN (tRNA processing enzyme)
VRGSCPCTNDTTRRYGGNTACVLLESAGEPPLVLDLGTGLRALSERLGDVPDFRATALVSHLHFDHVQGLPFFTLVDRPGSRLDVYGPEEEGTSFEHAIDALICPPYFPVRISELRGEISLYGLGDEDLSVGAAKIKARRVPHAGTTLGYRVDLDGSSVAFLTDHQQPAHPGLELPHNVLELCDGVDLLIHDAQYTPEEFVARPHWGHSTVPYAVRVAAESGAHRLALFHHDPAHSDAQVDGLLAEATGLASRTGIDQVLAAAEGMTVHLERP